MPYAIKIQEYFKSYEKKIRILVKLIMDEIYEMIGKNYIYLFAWAKKARWVKESKLEENSILKKIRRGYTTGEISIFTPLLRN